jgi:fimbrial chaperone protein
MLCPQRHLFITIIMRTLTRQFPMLRACSLLVAVVLGLPGLATAGNFSVSPVRIFMKPAERATAVTIVNHGDTDLVIDTELTSWKQNPDGSFNQQPTDDVIVAPPQMRLAPKARQVVRVARVVPPTPGEQMTYRLLVREVPAAGPAKPGYNVNLSLAFSLPIFITPPGLKYDVGCKLVAAPVAPTAPAPAAPASGAPAAAAAPQPWLVARCDNSGSAHALITKITLLDATGQALASTTQAGYTLTGSGRGFELFKPAAGAAQAQPQGSLRLAISHDDGTQQSVNVTLPQ